MCLKISLTPSSQYLTKNAINTYKYLEKTAHCDPHGTNFGTSWCITLETTAHVAACGGAWYRPRRRPAPAHGRAVKVFAKVKPEPNAVTSLRFAQDRLLYRDVAKYYLALKRI